MEQFLLAALSRKNKYRNFIKYANYAYLASILLNFCCLFDSEAKQKKSAEEKRAYGE